MSKIMVLNDGETFTNIKGCKIVEISDKHIKDLNDDNIDALVKDVCFVGLKVKGINVIGTFNERGEIIK